MYVHLHDTLKTFKPELFGNYSLLLVLLAEYLCIYYDKKILHEETRFIFH